MILSGSSESGKTRFARDLLQRQDLFADHVQSVVYYYPCYLEEKPVSWHTQLEIPVTYHVGLPTKDELIALPKNCCVVLDDLYDDAIKSETIDHLFRVISGKKKICVMIMTQNNFTQGKYGRDIRNTCNFSVLFRNCCDSHINKRVTSMAGLGRAYDAAVHSQRGDMYPYMFIDQSQQGQLSNYRLYTDIFSAYKIVWSLDGMKGYVVGETDFLSVFQTIESNKKFEATSRNDNQKQRKVSKVKFTNQTSSEESQNSYSFGDYTESDSSDESAGETYTKKKRRGRTVYQNRKYAKLQCED